MRNALGKLRKEAGDDCRRLLELIREAHAQQVADPIPWLFAAVRARASSKSRAAGVFLGRPELPEAYVASPGDWGIRAWVLRQPDVRIEHTPDARREEIYAINGWIVEDDLAAVLAAAEVPPSSRINLDAAGAWFRDGLDIQARAVLDAVASRAKRLDEPPRSLAIFDDAVRWAAKRAAA
jgi:hypothetical protein